jgi:hypothetical protein
LLELIIILILFYGVLYFVSKNSIERSAKQFSVKNEYELISNKKQKIAHFIYDNAVLLKTYYSLKNDTYNIIYSKLKRNGIVFLMNTVQKKVIGLDDVYFSLYFDYIDNNFKYPLKNIYEESDQKFYRSKNLDESICNAIIKLNDGFIVEISNNLISLGLLNRQFNLKEMEKYFDLLLEIENYIIKK